MNDFTLSNVDDVVLVTLTNVPNSSNTLADIFEEIGNASINIDMICQTAPYKEKINLSFTINQSDLAKTLAVVGQIKNEYEGLVTEISTGNCKFMIYSELLKTHWGVASKLFKALSSNNLQIKLITTSDVEISILLDNSEFDKINYVLNKEFIG